ncbi:MAG TPA: type II secretion system F family protein [Syntrophomonas sp.]|nr:type II secretion system F family protein [Syntrophomonas sp.]
MEALICTLVFLFIFLLVYGVYKLSMRNRENIKDRVLSLGAKNHNDIDENLVVKQKYDYKNFLRGIGHLFAAKSYTRKLEAELSKADILLRGEEFIGLNILVTLIGGLMGFMLFGGISQAFLIGFICLLIPTMMVKHKKKTRLNKLNEQISDCLTVMTNSLRAGYSFQQALDLVAREMNGPLAIEFRRTLREINFGNTTEQALMNLVQRAESNDLELMLTAVLIQRQIGGNLAEIFDNISNSINDRIRLKGEIKTLTAQGRISGLMIGLLPVALFGILILISPDYIGVLLKESSGRIIMGAAVVSEIIGFLMVRKVVDIGL